MLKNYKRLLTIAGFDGSGGAGIQADIKTFSALGCYGMTVLTSLPIQNTTGVKSIYDLPTESIKEQLLAILEDIGVDAIKIGMVNKPEIIEIITSALSECTKNKPYVIIDPVMVAKSGDILVEENLMRLIRDNLFKFATIITPNIDEATALLEGYKINDKQDMECAAASLLSTGAKYILLKGGHMPGIDSADYLCGYDVSLWISSKRVNTQNLHGTGCTLSSAIACFLAQGLNIESAVTKAKKYIYGAIKAGSQYKIGLGSGPVHHFFKFWQ